MPDLKSSDSSKSNKRVTTTLSDEDYQRLVYWSEKNGCSINQYIKDAILLKIRLDNHDYDLPELWLQRMNQLVDIVTVLSQNINSLEHITVAGFDSLSRLTRGDSYLND